jgi:hypothetical protein
MISREENAESPRMAARINSSRAGFSLKKRSFSNKMEMPERATKRKVSRSTNLSSRFS